MIYEKLFVDLGKVSELECVLTETKNRPCLLKAVGERGELVFDAQVAFSKMYPEGCDLPCPSLFDLGVAAYFARIRRDHSLMLLFKRMKKGDTIVLSDEVEALKMLRESGLGMFGAPPSVRRWINAEGQPVSEPRDFLAKHLAASFCMLERDLHNGVQPIDGCLSQLLEITRKTVGDVSGVDFDFLLQWHERLQAAARTINHHIDIGDYTPNMQKIDALLSFFGGRQADIDRLMNRDLFAAHLHERTDEIYASRRKNWKVRIGNVEPFSAASFPGSRHL